MLPQILTASFLVFCLAIFFAVNLYNIVKSHQGKKNVKVYAEVKLPESPVLSLGALGTFFFFIESILYSFLAFTGLGSLLKIFPLQLQFPFDSYVQVAGLILTGAGYFLFIWSVIVRGKYAVSWAMPEDQKLVTWGPYSYVRHPSYLGYFLMFFGLLLIWLNLIAVLPLMAIPGYMKIAAHEEELLIRRFGEKYLEYQKTTGRFFPKLK